MTVPGLGVLGVAIDCFACKLTGFDGPYFPAQDG